MRHGPAIADMDLQPVAVMLQLVRPARPGAWLRGIPLWLVRLLSGSVLGLGNDDYQGVYEMLCATYCDCKRL